MKSGRHRSYKMDESHETNTIEFGIRIILPVQKRKKLYSANTERK